MAKSCLVASVAILAMAATTACTSKAPRVAQGTSGTEWSASDQALFFTKTSGGATVLKPEVFKLNIAPLQPITLTTMSYCNGAQAPSRYVKLIIDDKFDAKDTGRNIFAKNRTGGNQIAVPEPTTSGTVPNTTYDILLNSDVWGANSTDPLIAVSIYLKDKDLIFVSDDYAISTMSPSPLIYCRDHLKHIADNPAGSAETDTPDPNGYDVATFYVNRSAIGAAKFNIWVVVKHKPHTGKPPYVLPLIIDPDVSNDG